MIRILFVTQDKRFWDSISMRRPVPSCFLMPAGDFHSAHNFLQSTRFDMVVVDISNGKSAAINLIGDLLGRWDQRRTQIVALSGRYSGAPRLTTGHGVLLATKDENYVCDCKRFLDLCNALREQHTLTGNGLTDLLELAEAEQLSLALTIRAAGRDAQIGISQGRLYEAHASDSDQIDAEVVAHIDGWDNAGIRSTPLNAAPTPRATEPPPAAVPELAANDATLADAVAPAVEVPVALSAPADTSVNAPEPITDAEVEEQTSAPIELPNMDELFRPFESEIPSFGSAILFDGHGDVLEHRGQVDAHSSKTISVAVHMLFASGRGILDNLYFADLEGMTLEAENGVIVVWPVREGMLAVTASEARSLGKIRLVARRVLPEFVQLMDAQRHVA